MCVFHALFVYFSFSLIITVRVSPYNIYLCSFSYRIFPYNIFLLHYLVRVPPYNIYLRVLHTEFLRHIFIVRVSTTVSRNASVY